MKTVNISNGGSASGSADAIKATFGGSGGGGTPKGKGTPKATLKKTPVRKRKQASASEVEDDDEETATPTAKKWKGGKKGAVKKEEGVEQYVTAESGGKEKSVEGDGDDYMGI